MSKSSLSSSLLFHGEKKLVGFRCPSGCTSRRTTDSARNPSGGLPPGAFPGSPSPFVLSGLAVAKRICRGPSEINPPPDCQIEPPFSDTAHSAVMCPLVETPATRPEYGGKSQWLPNAAYTTPSSISHAGRC